MSGLGGEKRLICRALAAGLDIDTYRSYHSFVGRTRRLAAMHDAVKAVEQEIFRLL